MFELVVDPNITKNVQKVYVSIVYFPSQKTIEKQHQMKVYRFQEVHFGCECSGQGLHLGLWVTFWCLQTSVTACSGDAYVLCHSRLCNQLDEITDS